MKIKKMPKSSTNSYYREVQGARIDLSTMRHTVRNFDVAFTSDDVGETISFCIDGISYTIPFEEIQELLNHTREALKNKSSQSPTQKTAGKGKTIAFCDVNKEK